MFMWGTRLSEVNVYLRYMFAISHMRNIVLCLVIMERILEHISDILRDLNTLGVHTA